MFEIEKLDIDKLTSAQLDRLQYRLTVRTAQREAERAATERERRNPQPLRPQIGSADITFGNDLSRRNWDQECMMALAQQAVPFAVAPMTSVLARDGNRLRAGQEVRPTEHLDARKGGLVVQVQKLVEAGFVLARTGAVEALAKAGAQ